MKVLRPANTYFMAVMDFNNYRLQNKCQKYNIHIAGKRAECSISADVQMKAANFRKSDPRSKVLFLDSSEKVCNGNLIHKRAPRWMFPNLVR